VYKWKDPYLWLNTDREKIKRNGFNRLSGRKGLTENRTSLLNHPTINAIEKTGTVGLANADLDRAL
jgi:hypothetical protein